MIYGRRHTYTRTALIGALAVLFIVASLSALFLARYQLMPYLTRSLVQGQLERTAESYGIELQVSEILYTNEGLKLVGVSARDRNGGHQLDIDTLLLRLGAGSILRPRSMLRSVHIQTMSLHLHESSSGIVVPRRSAPEINQAGVGGPGTGATRSGSLDRATQIPTSLRTEIWDDDGLRPQAISRFFQELSRLGEAPDVYAEEVALSFSSDRSRSAVPWHAAAIDGLHVGGGFLAGEFAFVPRNIDSRYRLPDSATVQMHLGENPSELHGKVSFSPELRVPLAGGLSGSLSSMLNGASNGAAHDLVFEHVNFDSGWISLEGFALQHAGSAAPFAMKTLRLGYSETREYREISEAWEAERAGSEPGGVANLARASLGLIDVAEFIEPHLNLQIDPDGQYRLPGVTPLLTELETTLKPGSAPTTDTPKDILSEFRLLLSSAETPLEVRVQNGSMRVHDTRSGAGHSSEISIHDLDLVLERSQHTLRIGTVGKLRRDAVDAGHWDLDLALDGRRVHDLHVDIDLPHLPVAAQLLGGRFIEVVRDGALELRLSPAPHTAGAADAGAWSAYIGLRNATLGVPFLAEEALSLADMSYAFTVNYDPQAVPSDAQLLLTWPDDRDLTAALGSVTVSDGVLTVGGMQLDFRPSLHGLFGLDGPPARADIDLKLPPTSLQLILDVVPAPILGELSGMRLGGDLAWEFQLELPLDRPSRMEWRSLLNAPEFEVVYLPPTVDVFRLAGNFEHTIHDPVLGYERRVQIPAMRPVSNDWMRRNSGMTPEEVVADPRRESWFTRVPEAPARQVGAQHRGTGYRYVRLEEMAPWIPRAVLSGEDSWFFAHRGFDWPAIKRAFELNLREGRVVVGASTISMQLMKNLYLNHDRVASRKLQEAFLVFLVEEVMELPKERMLELYLNIVEFGPEVFGIYDAAQHYFGKTPHQLDLTEAVWLASILPNPKNYHQQFEHGEVYEWWLHRKEQYMASMMRRNRLSQDQYDAALNIKPRFRNSGT